MKRLTAIAVAIFVSLVLYGTVKFWPESKVSMPVPEGIFSSDDIKYINDEGNSVYRLIRPLDDQPSTNAANYLFDRLKTVLNTDVKKMTDFVDGTDTYEILVGQTGRSESIKALQYLTEQLGGKYMDYIICVIGQKVVITGQSGEAINAACEFFAKNFLKRNGYSGGMFYMHATKGDFSSVTINGESVVGFHIVRDNANRSWLVQNEIDKMLDLVREKTGYQLQIEEDTETQKQEYEISIGNTNRAIKPETSYARDDYEIIVSGKKVYIMGGSTYAVQVAVTEFAAMLEKGAVTDADSKKGSYKQTIATYDRYGYYRLVWSEEFDGDTLDPKWYFVNGVNGKANAFKNEKTCEVKGGDLIMRALPNDEGGWDQVNAAESRNIVKFNRGYLEMRARIPDGDGVYSSFWTKGTGGMTGTLEIDIMESLGVAHQQTANIHKWQPTYRGGHTSLDGGSVQRTYTLKKGTLFDQYHTIALLWTDTEVRFFYDGYEYCTQPTDEFFKGKYISFLAGFNVGWKNRKDPDPTLEWPLEYRVDYFRLYQVSGQGIMLK